MSNSSDPIRWNKRKWVDHFLIDTWHDILSHLEDHRAAAALISIDLEKSFNRMNNLNCITALRAKGAPDHLAGMVQAYITPMRVF